MPEDQTQNPYDEMFSTGSLNPSELELYDRVAAAAAALGGGGKALDVGCGMGYMLQALERRGLSVHGLDFSDYAVQTSRRVVPNGEVVRGSAEDLPWPDASFDVVTCMGSLENFPRPEESLSEMRRVIKAAGRAFILLPNSHFIADFVNVLFYGTPKKNIQPIERFLSRVEWHEFLEKGGFEVVRTTAYNERRPITSPVHAAYSLIRPFIPLNLSYHFLFECTAR
ncbi:MAG TPA: class I SAM-dependent methyltransferase [Candidatus Rubrimentiphilum sp.]|nr:class I SAM-dependent methyltransferase [Candidatus Rubrimentiphilum sp.]